VLVLLVLGWLRSLPGDRAGWFVFRLMMLPHHTEGVVVVVVA